MQKKTSNTLIDNRTLKIIAAKKELLKDSIVIICVNEEKIGHIDESNLRKMTETIDNIEPSGAYFPTTRSFGIEFYDKSAFKNKDVLITVSTNSEMRHGDIMALVQKALPNAKSIDIVMADGLQKLDTR